MQHAHGRRIITGISLDYRADGASKSFSATVRFGSEEPGCATERTFYRGADIMGIGKKGHPHQQHEHHLPSLCNPRFAPVTSPLS